MPDIARLITPADAETMAAKKTSVLRPFRAKLGQRNSAPVNILINGDSTVEGARAPNTPWRSCFRDELRRRAGQKVTGGYGYVPAWYNTTDQVTPSPAQFSSTIGHNGNTIARAITGFGRRCLAMNPGDKVTLTIPATGVYKSTSVDCLWAKTANATSGIVIKLDGVQVFTSGTNSGVPAGGQTYRAAIPQDGAAHTIEIEVTGAILYYSGFMLYNGDETSGIRVVDGGSSGVTANHFTGTPTGTGNDLSFMLDDVAWLQPSLIVWMVGINNFFNSTSQLSTPAEYLAQLQTAHDNFNAKLGSAACPHVIIKQYERGPAASTAGLPYQWAAFGAAVDQFGAANNDTLVVDLMGRMPPGPQTTALGLVNADQTHLTDVGGTFVGDELVTWLLAA